MGDLTDETTKAFLRKQMGVFKEFAGGRHCEELKAMKQSTLRISRGVDCFASIAMTSNVERP